MTTAEWILLAGLMVNSLGLGVVLFKLVWGGGISLQQQFHTITLAFGAKVDEARNEWRSQFDVQSTNFGNVTANLNDRMHQIELKTMESRAIAAETYMRRESYYQASQELKRDVADAHSDLKTEVHQGFQKLEAQIAELRQAVMAH